MTRLDFLRRELRLILSIESWAYSCDQCPYGVGEPMKDGNTDTSERYFRCLAGLGPSPDRQWGEYAPCGESPADGLMRRALETHGSAVKSTDDPVLVALRLVLQ